MAPKIEKDAIHAFGAELAQELSAKVDERFSNHHWAFALIIEPGVRLFAQIENGKAVYSLSAIADAGRAQPVKVACGVAVSRGPEVAAQQIRARLLPDALPMARGYLDGFKEQDAALARVAKKAAQLAKRYPELRVSVSDQEPNRIRIATKYGAGVHLDAYAYAYAYESEPFGKWVMSSNRGRAFGLDDIDSKYGRAFLRLCNAK